MKSYHDIAGDGGSDVAAQVGAQQRQLQQRLADIGHVVAVMSGKGGVGKSTFTVNLADVLARQGQAIGILDADIHGASIPKMTGVRSHSPRAGSSGMLPAVARLGIRVMSMDLFLLEDTSPVLWRAPTQTGAYAWRPMVEMGALREMLADTEWGSLDVLLVDLPPGGDRLANLAELVPGLSGALAVTVGSDVSHLVVGRSITMAADACRVRMLGLVDNMGHFCCSRCGSLETLFGSARGSEEFAAANGLPYLGAVPFDKRIRSCADQGISFFDQAAGSMAALAYERIGQAVQQELVESEVASP